METRKERYAKKRAAILALPSSSFRADGSYIDSPSDFGISPSSSSISYSGKGMGDLSLSSSQGASTPYSLYLKRRHMYLAVKLSALALAIGLLIGAYFLFV